MAVVVGVIKEGGGREEGKRDLTDLLRPPMAQNTKTRRVTAKITMMMRMKGTEESKNMDGIKSSSTFLMSVGKVGMLIAR